VTLPLDALRRSRAPTTRRSDPRASLIAIAARLLRGRERAMAASATRAADHRRPQARCALDRSRRLRRCCPPRHCQPICNATSTALGRATQQSVMRPATATHGSPAGLDQHDLVGVDTVAGHAARQDLAGQLLRGWI
jgi:hypothetical protein